MAGWPSGLKPQQAVRGVPPSQPRCVSSPLPLGLHRMIRRDPGNTAFSGLAWFVRLGLAGLGLAGLGREAFFPPAMSMVHTSSDLVRDAALSPSAGEAQDSSFHLGEAGLVQPPGRWMPTAPGRGHPCGHHIILGSCLFPWSHRGAFRAIGLVNSHLLQKLMILTP